MVLKLHVTYVREVKERCVKPIFGTFLRRISNEIQAVYVREAIYLLVNKI